MSHQYHFEMTVDNDLMIVLAQLLHDRKVLFKMEPVLSHKTGLPTAVPRRHRDGTTTRQLILDRLENEGSATTEQLMNLIAGSGRSRMSLSSVISKLQRDGLVIFHENEWHISYEPGNK